MGATKKTAAGKRSRAKASSRAATATTATKPSGRASSSAITSAKSSTSAAPSKAETKVALFIEAYLANGLNATQAAITAGYSAKTAYAAGSRLLSKVEVAEAVARRTQTAVMEVGLDTERVLAELACIVHFDPRRLVDPATGRLIPMQQMDESTARAIASVEFDKDGNMVKVRAWDKNAALASAMRYLGLLKPDAPAGSAGTTIIHGQNVLVMTPAEAYRRMLERPKEAAPKPIPA